MGGRSVKTAHAVARAESPCQDSQEEGRRWRGRISKAKGGIVRPNGEGCEIVASDCAELEAAQILDQHEQVQRIGGRFHEIEAAIERTRGIVLGVNGKRPDAGNVGGL